MCFLPLVVTPQKILTGYFKDGVSFIPEVEYLFEKKSWKNSFGVVYYVSSTLIKLFILF